MFNINNIELLNKYAEKNKSDFDINKQDYLGNTILHKAVISLNFDYVKELLKMDGIDISINNIEGLSPIFYIVRNNYTFKEKETEKMLCIFLDIVGPSIFTIFDNNGKNILDHKIIQKIVTKLQNS